MGGKIGGFRSNLRSKVETVQADAPYQSKYCIIINIDEG